MGPVPTVDGDEVFREVAFPLVEVAFTTRVPFATTVPFTTTVPLTVTVPLPGAVPFPPEVAFPEVTEGEMGRARRAHWSRGESEARPRMHGLVMSVGEGTRLMEV
ncbi:hypothetical protein M427DRAFT_464364 [Gonapodya prolifera JEL478]|uniref:Uncharacterized protein n=1 Tax=Gonapodya prolifera (strain JEL478) TaxID=1344416 RepID=A0A139A1U8_GONPJ|nr:hypothetical protein M427DRAFT_464364 [Gonapodya prolifera JEL478]|eukprot:KXS10714.1 hypothetical protein M427DRAFT_464364 [Gonapodya prolifera JEL478]